MSLLFTYSLQKTSSTNFGVTFTIPTNCGYTTRLDSKGVNFITITLNTGHTTPAATFSTYTVPVTVSGDDIAVDFEQVQSGTTVTKPKIRVESC